MGLSSSDKASKQARADEMARLASIARTQGAINSVFNSPERASDIADFVAATRDYFMRDLNEQKVLNDRQLKFALARGGQVGGTLQRDKQAQFGRDYGKGVLTVERKAQGAGADLEGQDQAARQQLLSLATTGIDANTGASQAAAAMRSSLEGAKSTSQMQNLGDLFGSFSKFYEDSKNEKARRQGWDYAGQSLYQQNPNLTYGRA